MKKVLVMFKLYNKGICHQRRSVVFIVNHQHISHLFLVFRFSSVDFEHVLVYWIKSKGFEIKIFPRKHIHGQSHQVIETRCETS